MFKLYYFIKDEAEFRCTPLNDGDYEFICLMDVTRLPAFYEILSSGLGANIFDDGGIELRLMDGYFGVDIFDLVSEYDEDGSWVEVFMKLEEY